MFPCKVSVHLKFWINLILFSFVVPSKGKIKPIALINIQKIKKKKLKHQVRCRAKIKPTVRKQKRERRYNAVWILLNHSITKLWHDETHKTSNQVVVCHLFPHDIAWDTVKILHRTRNETALHIFYRIGIPCRREKYASVAFFMISGLQVMSVNISSSLALVVLRSLDS